MIQFGLRLHDAEKLPVEQVLPLVRQKGFTCAHVALSKSFKELPCTPSALTPGYALYLRHLFEKNGIDIAVLGNYLNLAHPDADALHAIQEKYYAHIRFASLLGCGMVGTETGGPDAGRGGAPPRCGARENLLCECGPQAGPGTRTGGRSAKKNGFATRKRPAPSEFWTHPYHFRAKRLQIRKLSLSLPRKESGNVFRHLLHPRIHCDGPKICVKLRHYF